MADTLTFPFDELPLLIEHGAEAGLVNGEAEIAYWPDGSWSIRNIALDSHLRVGSSFIRGQISLDPGTPLYLMIYGRLEGEWREHVQSAVDEAIAAFIADRSATAADHRNRLMKEGV